MTLAYQRFTAVFLYLSEWRLLLSECVLVFRRENVGTNIKFLVKLGKSGSEITEILMQV
jgi:hypothetical protein